MKESQSVNTQILEFGKEEKLWRIAAVLDEFNWSSIVNIVEESLLKSKTQILKQ